MSLHLRTLLVALGFALPTVAQSRSQAPPQAGTGSDAITMDLRVMTFNVWLNGGNVNQGAAKIVSAIQVAGADLVFTQEASSATDQAAVSLGWHAYTAGSTGILSRFPIFETFPGTLNGAGTPARIQLSANPPQDLIVASAHLSPYPYGPYSACLDGAGVGAILADETSSGRLSQVRDLLDFLSPYLAAADRVPVLVAGDFNVPSHLDWTADTASTHCGYSIDWPVTLELEAAGLRDAFRAVFPDPLLDPGNTWSPVYPFNDPPANTVVEPQDRIDMIHVAGSRVAVQDAGVFVVGMPSAYPSHTSNAWPSDHAAVVADLTVRLGGGSAPSRLPELSLDQRVYLLGEDIVCSFVNGPGNARDWVGIYSDPGNGPDACSSNGPSTVWLYTNGSQSPGGGAREGSVTFATANPAVGGDADWPLPAGDYIAHFLADDGYCRLGAPVRFSVQP